MSGGEDEDEVVRVRVLNGQTVLVPSRDSMTIRGLKKHLKSLDQKYEGCKLLSNGYLLKNSQLVGDLRLGKADCQLTAVLCARKATKNVRSRIKDEYDCCAQDAVRTEECRERSGTVMDTLLPGYNVRPNPSPVKKREQDDIGWLGDAILCENPGTDRSEEKKGSVLVSNATLAEKFHHLPDALVHLEQTYDMLWRIHAFLFGTLRTRCSFKSVEGVLRENENLRTDIDPLVILCPCLVVLRHSESCPNQKTFSSCLQCSERCLIDLKYPWKSRSEKIPEEFRLVYSERVKRANQKGMHTPDGSQSSKRKSTGLGQKRLRQCWILRKCLINYMLSEYDPKYDNEGLWLCGITEKQINDDLLIERCSMSNVVAWRELFPCDTVSYMYHDNIKRKKYDTRGENPPVLLKKASPCTNSVPLAPEDLLSHIKGLEYYNGQVVYEKLIPPKEPSLIALENTNLSDVLKKYFAQELGITSLYSHQAAAVHCLMSREKDCIISTSTSSGKSFCYLIPLFELLLLDQEACALLMFPTKALSQDQYRNIREMTKGIFGDSSEDIVQIYDGDTVYEERNAIIAKSRILLTNPDMLHCSILPFHRKFSHFLGNLQLVSIDEAHMYRGVFGAHVALVIRRLKRICKLYKSKPKLVLTTATVSNPKEHASCLVGVDDIELISIDGSPQQAKTFALWNPPFLNNASEKLSTNLAQQEKKRKYVRNARQERKFPALLGANAEQNRLWNKSVALGKLKPKKLTIEDEPNYRGKRLNGFPNVTSAPISTEIEMRMPSRGNWMERISRLQNKETREKRSSSIVEISFLLSECVKHGLRAIAFCKTRKLAELVGAYTREIVAATCPELVTSISVYRSGYSPLERRDIERRIFNGELLGTCATNALELGVDIGGLDVTLHLGYQGTVASLWQQAGRAGRRDRQSLSIYVAFDGPLDQYFMKYPQKLFDRPIEAAYIDISNSKMLEAHCACAAFEIELEYSADYEAFGFDTFMSTVRVLIEKGSLSLHPTRPGLLEYSGKASLPARKITLRDIDQDKYTIVDDTNRVLEEIEACKVNFVCYDGAIYMSQGQTYIVKSVDYSSRIARVSLTDVKYYTATIDYTDVHLKGEKKMCSRASKASVGHAIITTRWMGYARIWRGSGNVFDTVDLFVPDAVYETVAVSQRVPRRCRHSVEEKGYEFRDSLHAAAHAVMNVFPLYIMCNAEDIATECDNQYDTRYKPERLLVFDKYPGGIGLCEKARPIFHRLILAALELIKSCPCNSEDGCPGCVQSTVCSEYNGVLSKPGAKDILEIMSQDCI